MNSVRTLTLKNALLLKNDHRQSLQQVVMFLLVERLTFSL